MSKTELRRRIHAVNKEYGTTRLCVVPEEGGKFSVWSDGAPLVRDVEADEAWKAVVALSYRLVK